MLYYRFNKNKELELYKYSSKTEMVSSFRKDRKYPRLWYRGVIQHYKWGILLSGVGGPLRIFKLSRELDAETILKINEVFYTDHGLARSMLEELLLDKMRNIKGGYVKHNLKQ